MGEPLIKNLDHLIKQYVSKNETIKKIDVSNLLAPGENYLSDMMKVDVYLKNKVTEAEKEIHAVAKCVTGFPGADAGNEGKDEGPNEFMSFVFLKEIAFYKDIVPAIQTFLRKKGQNEAEYFAKFYGARLNLNGSNVADKDAVLLLENANFSGYKNLDRHVGFDFDSAKTVIKDLAHLHAVCVAMKRLDPDLFQKTIKKHCDSKLFPPPPPTDGEPPPQVPHGFNDETFRDILEEDEKCRAAIPSFMEMLQEQKKLGFEAMYKEAPREPYATLMHSDMWMNNTMQQVDRRGVAVKSKFVDFQVYGYGNPMRDLQFLLQTSVQLPVLETRFDYLIRFYHDNYVKVLKDLGCDVTEFSYERLLDEVKAVMPSLLTNGSFMLLMIVFGTKGVAANPLQMHTLKKDDIDPRARAKFQFIVREAYQRGWLPQ